MKGKVAILVLNGLAVLCSCTADYDEVLAYSVMDCGCMVSGVFYSDEGNTMNITENLSEAALTDCERVFITCDVLRYNGDNNYDIRLRTLNEPLCKSPLVRSGMTDSITVSVGADAIRLYSGWYSGGYMNMKTYIYFDHGSPTSHYINFIYEDLRPITDTLYFSLTHNAFGETYNPGLSHSEQEDIVLGYSYLSFPIKDYLPSGHATIPIVIEYPWYSDISDGYPAGDITTYRITGNISR